MDVYQWPAVDEFRDRASELKRLEQWWSGERRDPINLYGRRRVGKSWLSRRFAHGKPAVILVADRGTPAQQLAHLATQLEPALGVRPALDDLADLFRVLYRLAAEQQVLSSSMSFLTC